MTCVTHGHYMSHDLLDATFGIGTAEYSRIQAEHAPPAPIKCPADRYAMSQVASPSGRVRAQACGRCGSIWMPLSVIEELQRTTPLPEGTSMSETRSVLALAAARGLVTPAGKAPRPR